jgi:hypothetical protein
VLDDDDFFVPDDLASQIVFVSTAVVSAVALGAVLIGTGFVVSRLTNRERS